MNMKSELKKLMKKRIERFGGNNISCSKKYFYNEGQYSNNRDAVREILLKGNVPKNFDTLYDQAIGGSGCEDANMTNIISSALWAFLFFANVSEEHPLTIDKVEYIHVCFEFKNRTLAGNKDFAPSNMDVVLADKNYENIMFVESKFGEYVYDRSKSKLSIQYAKKGNTQGFVKNLLEQGDFGLKESGDSKHILFSNEKEYYSEGIKQMITHISGLGNFRDTDKRYSVNTAHLYDYDKKKFYENAETANIVLQEIVFDFSELAKSNDVSDTELVKALKNSFDDYEKLHEKLAGCWNDEYGKYEEYGKFKVGDLLTYQEIAKDNEKYVGNALPKNVRDIYVI